MKHFKLLAALVLTLVATAATGEVYKWVDADGKVHYGDRKPASGSDSRVIELEPAPSKDANHAERSAQRRRLLDAFEAERAQREEAEAQAAAEKREHEERCARVRRDLARFERANIVYTQDESGARIYMNDEKRRSASADARAWIDEHCE